VSSKTNSNVNNRDDMKKYFKMKKMGLPEGAVRQKMQTDGMSAADIAAFFGESPPAAAAPPKTNSDLKNREDMKKYFKMKKMGLPDGAIRQKMKQDGISASDAAAFFGEAPPANSSKNGVHIPRIDLSALRAKQTARRAEMETAGGAMSKYFKMQSMGIPMGAIRMKMKADGIDAADIAAFCGDMPAGGPPGRPATLAEQKSQQARLKLKKLHWKKLDSTRAQKSVWGQSMSQQTTRSDSARDKDMDELAKHFGQKIGKGKKDGKRGGRGSSLGAGAAGESKAPKRLLDGKRARNIEIGLAQFRAFKQYEDIGECIESLDESRISADRLETLLGISPTPQEMQMFEGHLKRGTDLSALGAAEKFHVAATKVARFREKVRAFLFKSHFSDLVEQLEDQGKTLCKAIDQITMSKKLTRVLETVLSVGNLMNQGTHAGDAVGITLDSLLKLTSTKSHDNKMTVLDYVVQTMLKSKEKRAHTSFPEELSQLRNATKCAPKVLTSGLVALQKGIAHMKREGERDSSGGTGSAAEGKDASGSVSKFAQGCERFLARIGEPKVNELSGLLKSAETACAKLREHFGEDPKCDVVNLFTVLEKFSASFAKSVKKHVEKEARRERTERAKEAKEKKERSRQSRRHSRSPERAGGRRASRSPVGRRHRRSRSLEGKNNGNREANEGKTGGANLLAAIMAKGGLRGLKTDISLKSSASPGTRRRHDVLQELMATLIQMKHPQDEVKSIAERLASGR
jgi:hypothetical protein